ncbi:hypothetical protein ACIB24_00415 [Spongisporangium articulatum]|uniref:Uncharacterized protein n=1 Tax=Spongisporangium articulatum TaxID=3362603 RepID=A0ABW8AHS9_9ACTN
MSQPRFLLLHGIWDRGAPRPVWPNADDAVRRDGVNGECWYSWRLLGTNNRELGRGSLVYVSPQACLEAIQVARRDVADLRPSVVIGQDRQWWWRADLGGSTFAVAARGYQRQRECRYSLGMFAATLATADGLDGLEAECPDGRCTTPGPGRRSARGLRMMPVGARGVA